VASVCCSLWTDCSLQTAPLFTYNSVAEKFEGPAQKTRKEQDIAKATEEEERKQVSAIVVNFSKKK